MHELSIIKDIFSTVEQVALGNNLNAISIVRLKIGKLQHTNPEFLQFAFEQVTKDTIAENAKLLIEEIPVTIRCNKCDMEIEVGDNIYLCPRCESGSVELISGKELILDNIEGV